MSLDIITAHRLAHEIEWIQAKERARLRHRLDAEMEFDPLVATSLGDWIYQIANQRRGK